MIFAKDAYELKVRSSPKPARYSRRPVLFAELSSSAMSYGVLPKVTICSP